MDAAWSALIEDVAPPTSALRTLKKDFQSGGRKRLRNQIEEEVCEIRMEMDRIITVLSPYVRAKAEDFHEVGVPESASNRPSYPKGRTTGRTCSMFRCRLGGLPVSFRRCCWRYETIPSALEFYNRSKGQISKTLFGLQWDLSFMKRSELYFSISYISIYREHYCLG